MGSAGLVPALLLASIGKEAYVESNQYILEETTEDVVIAKVPNKCPDCGSEDIRIEGCTLRTNDPSISVERDKLLLSEEGDYILYVMAFGWYCVECGLEEFFYRIFRIVWD